MTARRQQVRRKSLRAGLVCWDASTRRPLHDALAERGITVYSHQTIETFLATQATNTYDCLVFDQWRSGLTVFELKRSLEERGISVPIVAMHSQEPDLFAAFRNLSDVGIQFLDSNWDEAKVAALISRAVS